ncbi:MAG: hypothetical protein GY811_18865 [Myxococcales bacterium]|nr:hypothetical protein [Myxococcales bacterium]
MSALRILQAVALASALSLCGCGPSASVKRTTPVANLQSYQNVLVRVASAQGLERYTSVLEFATTDSMMQRCAFTRVGSPTQVGQTRPDLLVDLNIRRTQRGGGGLIKNPNLATVNVTMVLSDGIDESLLGSAEIEGKSSAVGIDGADPEDQALIAVAKRVTAILSKSGCTGERVARAATPVEPAEPVQPVGITPEQLAQAETANDEGKRLFRAAEIAAAKEQFLQAIRVSPSPKYQFNLCLAHEALNEYDQAAVACQQVIDGGTEPRLSEKAQQRLTIIADKRAG